MLELVFLGEVGVDHGALERGMHVPVGLGLFQHVGQAMIGLRPEHQVDHRRAARNFLAFGLGDAAGHADHHVAARSTLFALQFLEPSEFGEHLFAGLFTDMAGVEQHQVRLADFLRRHIAVRRQRVGHAIAVIDVHLAARGLDEDAFGRSLGHGFGLCHGGLFTRACRRIPCPCNPLASRVLYKFTG